MRSIKVTPTQRKVLDTLTRKDLNTLRRYPAIVKEGRHLIRACKKVIRHVKALHQYSNVRKRQTAYARILKACEAALERVEG